MCILNLKIMPVNNEDAHLWTQSRRGGGGWNIWSPILLPSFFSMSLKLGGNINWWLVSRSSRFFLKNYQAVFKLLQNLSVWTKLQTKIINGNESSRMQANQILLSHNWVKFSAIFSWSTITAELPCPLMSPFCTKIICESVSSSYMQTSFKFKFFGQ